MIVGVDHIALSDSIESAFRQELDDMGYICSFSQRFKDNVSSKQQFMRYQNNPYSLNFFKKEGLLPVELLEYEHIVESNLRTIEFNFKDSIFKYNVFSLEEEIEFFKKLGFKVLEKDANHCSLLFKSIFNESFLKIYLNKVDENIADRSDLYIDSKGPGVLAFQVVNLKRSLKKLNCLDNEINSIMVQNNEFEVTFVKSPDGILIELIRAKRMVV